MISGNFKQKFLGLFPDGPRFVTAFEPTEGAMKIAHHMRLFACAPGWSDATYHFPDTVFGGKKRKRKRKRKQKQISLFLARATCSLSLKFKRLLMSHRHEK